MAFKFDFFSDGTETKEETPKSKLCPLDGNVTKVDLCSLKLVPYYPTLIVQFLQPKRATIHL